MIAKCDSCKPHAFQDAKYGVKVRVMNVMDHKKWNDRPITAVCTVCGRTHENPRR